MVLSLLVKSILYYHKCKMQYIKLQVMNIVLTRIIKIKK